MTLESVNPATGQTIKTYEEMDEAAIQMAVEQSHSAYLDWRETGFAERGRFLCNMAEALRQDGEELARLMSQEMGKPIKQSRAEIEKCAWGCEYYAEHGEAFLAPETVETDAQRSYITYRPLGIVLAVMPWNFPFWQVIRFTAPALMAGNAVLLKHAGNVTGCGLAIEGLFRRAGFPEGLFRTLLIGSDKVQAVLSRPEIAAVTLTGSTGAGQAVASGAGERVKKTVLELGGSDPYLILEDADLEGAVEACTAGRLQNTGQSCIAAKRLVVVEPLVEEFQQRLMERMKGYKMGDPLEEESDLGPQARADLRDAVHKQVLRSVERGAKLLLGGEVPDGPGAYYPATLLTNVQKGMPAYDEEVFGPVAAVIMARDEEDAIRIANDTPYGLGAAVFTKDVERGEKIAAERIEAGSCFVNAFVKSDPRLPFGGVKGSGYGRELSELGIREFVNVKTVYIA